MEILVCIKQVPDDSIEIHLDPATNTPDLSKADPQASAFDTYALELAVRYVEAHEGTVTVVSVGPEENNTSLKSCLAVGAKKAYLINDAELAGADSNVVAEAIAQAIPQMEEANGAKFDLILVGKESTDYIDGEVGGILAEKLGLPYVSNIVEVNPVDAGVQSKKETDEGYQIVESALPAIMTVSKPDYDPRYPTIKSKLAARKAEVPVIAAAASEAKVEYLGYKEPAKKAAGIKIQEEEDATAVSKAIETMLAAKAL
ncbi:MAG: electron transfer flavoprotein subunit beta/FixA family protein [Eubacterium sp.]|jgi:electron transfer flavoprotein alpha/beta subunit